MSKDLFAQVPEFLAAFNNILKNGFFEDIKLSVNGPMMEGKIYGCSITATDCVPVSEEYAADGCGAVIDPNVIIAACRKLAGQKKVTGVTTKVETEDWQLFHEVEGNVIGSKGKRTELYLYVSFKV